jgi:hypothetical protein
MPVPKAFETASLAAKRAAKCSAAFAFAVLALAIGVNSPQKSYTLLFDRSRNPAHFHQVDPNTQHV